MTFIWFLKLAATTLAACIVMYVHELPKVIIAIRNNRECTFRYKLSELNVFRYIDPIGLILFIVAGAGFQRPYPCDEDERAVIKKHMGIAGFSSLIIMIFISYIIIRYGFKADEIISFEVSSAGMQRYFFYKLISNILRFSITLIVVNMFPINNFDLALIIDSTSYKMKSFLIKNDMYVKFLLLFCIMVYLVESITTIIVTTII